MELTGEKVINAPQERVYEALQDPNILRQSLPGIQNLTRVGADRYDLTAAFKVGALRPTFHGALERYNEDRPSGFSVRGSASSGSAGSVTGNAHLALAAIDADTTNLAYHVTADLDGQLSTMEGVKLEATGRTLVSEFFSRLEALIETTDASGDLQHRTSAAAGGTGGGTDAGRVPQAEPANGGLQSARRAPSPTDATGASRTGADASSSAPAYEPTPAMAKQEGYPQVGNVAYEGTYGGGYDTPMVDTTTATGSGIGRWLGVAIGLLLIAVLLNDSF